GLDGRHERASALVARPRSRWSPKGSPPLLWADCATRKGPAVARRPRGRARGNAYWIRSATTPWAFWLLHSSVNSPTSWNFSLSPVFASGVVFHERRVASAK